MTTVFAYVRVSTQMQTKESQVFEIENWCRQQGWTVAKWVEESISGTVPWNRRSLGKMLRRMKPDDVLVCTEISRLGRNMLMIMSILNYCVQHKLRLYTIKDRFSLSNDINSKIIAFAFALASEIERNLISQRTKEALAAKKMAGVQLGRPKGCSAKTRKMLLDMPAIKARLDNGESARQVAKDYGVHRNTLSLYKKTAGGT